MIKRCIILSIFVFSSITSANINQLPIPRFASIKSNEVNARTGPTIKCPIDWVFIKKGEPVEITAEYGQWRRIQDINGEGGWVHSSVLSGNRSVIIIGDKEVNLAKSQEGKIVAKIFSSVRCSLKKCAKLHCQIICHKQKGWVPKASLWGVYQDEKNY